jgi:hypothetical protein
VEEIDWVINTINKGWSQRESCWTESIVVGSSIFIEEAGENLGLSNCEKYLKTGRFF